jgi:hypothetical protein
MPKLQFYWALHDMRQRVHHIRAKELVAPFLQDIELAAQFLSGTGFDAPFL